MHSRSIPVLPSVPTSQQQPNDPSFVLRNTAIQQAQSNYDLNKLMTVPSILHGSAFADTVAIQNE